VAKFTAGVDLNIRLPNGEELIGAAGTTHRFSDALVDEFVRDVVPHIPGGITWINQDETSAIGGGASVSVAAETTFSIATSAGTAASFSRGDHTHGSPTLSAAVSVSAETTYGISSSVGTATTVYALGDHTHGSPVAISPATAVSGQTSYGAATAVGSSALYARQDHTHGTPADPVTSGAGFTVPSGTLAISATSSTMTIGSDVNLYRSAADVLATDDTFKAPKFAYGIQSGVITVSLVSQSVNTATVTFATAFPAAPQVVCTGENVTSSGLVAKIDPGSISSTGFRASVTHVANTSLTANVPVHWIAVYSD